MADLSGVNKCQCGLQVGGLPTFCELGHLHHLATEDGNVYHYLQLEHGKQTFLGRGGSHFKNVTIKGRVFPGNFLVVGHVVMK